MAQVKPALDYPEQIEKLKNDHHLLINDEENALKILKQVNYYRLSGYGIGLKEKDNKEYYMPGISIDHLFRLYNFDSLFRNILIHTIEQIEIQLRTQISNFLALKYGSEGYMIIDNFIDKRRTSDNATYHSIVLESFKKEIDHQKNAPMVIHHKKKYNGHFPIWVAVELFTFGNLSSLFNIMKKDDRKSIARLYNTEPDYLGSWILALVEIRNICAHYSRLYNMPLKQRPHLYSEYQRFQSSTINKVFPSLITIKRMLNSDDRWTAFETELEKLIDEYNDVVILSYMGFPKEWKDILT